MLRRAPRAACAQVRWATTSGAPRPSLKPGSTAQAIDVTGDPFESEHNLHVKLSTTKYAQLQGDIDGAGKIAVHADDIKRVLTVQQALQILDVKKDAQFGMNEDEVREAWSRMFQRASSERERQEINAAADVLMDFLGSEFGKERTKDHFADHILKAKRDVKRTMDEDREKTRSLLWRGLGFGHLCITCIFMTSTVMMYRYVENHDASRMVAQARRSVAQSTNAVSNYEPAPDYVTRYRDTQSAFDERLTQPHPEITEPSHRHTLLSVESDRDRDEALLAQLTGDIDDRLVERQARLRQEEERRAAIRKLDATDMIDMVVRATPPRGARALGSSTH